MQASTVSGYKLAVHPFWRSRNYPSTAGAYGLRDRKITLGPWTGHSVYTTPRGWILYSSKGFATSYLLVLRTIRLSDRYMDKARTGERERLGTV